MDDRPLAERLTYTTKCGHCGGTEAYTMRDTDTNTTITDQDAVRMAMSLVGRTEPGYCEHCERITLHTITCYHLPYKDSENG